MKKLKSTFIIWIAIYPAITTILLLFGEYLNELPILKNFCAHYYPGALYGLCIDTVLDKNT